MMKKLSARPWAIAKNWRPCIAYVGSTLGVFVGLVVARGGRL